VSFTLGVSPGRSVAITDGVAEARLAFGGTVSTSISLTESITRLSSRRTTRIR
jgi:hypothetical protein